ncbi:WD repeat-containing protein 44 [Borealophlyctis nickersoniae]|nr:WD repeat-containing protein 44 [Borealophlyctis nickersoniae]
MSHANGFQPDEPSQPTSALLSKSHQRSSTEPVKSLLSTDTSAEITPHTTPQGTLTRPTRRQSSDPLSARLEVAKVPDESVLSPPLSPTSRSGSREASPATSDDEERMPTQAPAKRETDGSSDTLDEPHQPRTGVGLGPGPPSTTAARPTASRGNKSRTFFGRLMRGKRNDGPENGGNEPNLQHQRGESSSSIDTEMEEDEEAGDIQSFISGRTSMSEPASHSDIKGRGAAHLPPRPIKVKVYHKTEKDLEHLTRVQILGDVVEAGGTKTATSHHGSLALDTQSISGASIGSAVSSSGESGSLTDGAEVVGPIWAMRFSNDGKYLAAGGQDCVLRVWIVDGAEDGENKAGVDGDREGHHRQRQESTGTPEPEAFRRSMDTYLHTRKTPKLGLMQHQHSFPAAIPGNLPKRPSDESFRSFHSAKSVPEVRDLPTGELPHEQRQQQQQHQHPQQQHHHQPQSHAIFRARPHRIYRGHTGEILDIAWSSNNFLASASMDKHVRIYHISRSECLCSFAHLDWVTSVKFHPLDDRFVLTGSLDSRIRVWNLQSKRVVNWNEAPNSQFITAVCFTQDGTYCVAGTYAGDCVFYEFDGLKYNTQISVKSSRGRNKKGRKITGIEVLPFHHGHGSHGEERLVVTSNDSRVRLYNVRDKSLYRKYKGCENRSSQIRAMPSWDGRWIVCGSEDRSVVVWDSGGHDRAGAGGGGGLMGWVDGVRSGSYEKFVGSGGVVTCAVVAPKKVDDLLGGNANDSAREREAGGKAEGLVIVTGDVMGRIRVYVNRAPGTRDAGDTAGANVIHPLPLLAPPATTPTSATIPQRPDSAASSRSYPFQHRFPRSVTAPAHPARPISATDRPSSSTHPTEPPDLFFLPRQLTPTPSSSSIHTASPSSASPVTPTPTPSRGTMAATMKRPRSQSHSAGSGVGMSERLYVPSLTSNSGMVVSGSVGDLKAVGRGD